ncbi:MAG TPA: NADH-quinone oxidoreductase subunit J [Terriglobales bacterium]|nr:NADH-quinone oxidoreductase subunit J [Terriglobales bacterium]
MNTIPGANWIVQGVFILCLATLVAGALIAVSSHKLIRSVCGLAICCLGLAGLYYFLNSPFLALMEILIYVGAVCITIVFAIMLAEPDEPPREEKRSSAMLWGGISFAAAAALFFGLLGLSRQRVWAPASLESVNDGSLGEVGRALLTSYGLAFEMISLALLIAIIGALALARTGRSKS